MTILMLETIDNDAMTVLENAGTVLLSPTPNALKHDLAFADVSAIITRGIGQLDRRLINKCAGLKVIARCGAGLNNVDLEAAAEKNVPVIFAPGLNATAVAEHTMMLMLMSIRNGFSSSMEVKRNNWACRNGFKGDDLYGKKVCIVGAGNIGGTVAELCRNFSMEVVLCGRNGEGITGLRAALKSTLSSCDIVSIHIPLTDETNQIIDDELLSFFKPGAVLINTARGELVETQALIKVLDQGKLSCYGADVVSEEAPDSGDPLTANPNTIITPHVASLTKRTYREISLFTAENVASVLAGEIPDPASVYKGTVN